MSAQRLLKPAIIRRSNRPFKAEYEELIKNQKNETVKSIVEKLLPSIPLSQVVDSSQSTLLHLAAKYNNVELIIFFANSGCNVNARNNSSLTPLSTAFTCNHVEAVDTLLSLGAELNNNDVKRTLRTLIAKHNRFTKAKIIPFMKRLKECTEDVKTMANLLAQVDCPLKLVVSMRDAHLTQTILDSTYYTGLNEEDVGKAVEYTMQIAAINHLRVLWRSDRIAEHKEYLFEQFCCQSFKWSLKPGYQTVYKQLNKWIVFDDDFQSFLRSIFESANKCTLKALLNECNVDVQIKQNYGFDVLPILFSNWHINNDDVIEFALKRKFDVNARSFKGKTALHFAVETGSLYKVRLLLDMGADCDTEDDGGNTAFDLIRDEYVFEIFLQGNNQFRIGENCEFKVLKCLHDESVRGNLWTIVLAQLAIERYQGVKIKQRIVDEINSSRLFKNYFKKCLHHVESMTSFEILPYLTLFSVLTSKAEYLSLYIRNLETVSGVTQWCSRQTSLPSFYCSTLKFNLEKAHDVYRARCRMASIIYESTSVLIYDGDLVIDKIFGYLVYSDMLMLAPSPLGRSRPLSGSSFLVSWQSIYSQLKNIYKYPAAIRWYVN